MSDPCELLTSLDPKVDALIEYMRPRLSDSHLSELAAADYGMDFEQHLEALTRIRDSGTLPAQLEWHPREVLELIRWSRPDDPNWKPGAQGPRGHLLRAFACAMLIRSAYLGANSGNENQTLVQLIDSALVLKLEFPALALRLIAAVTPHIQDERPYFILGLVLLLVAREEPADDALLGRLVKWLMDDERRVLEMWDGRYMNGQRWLFGTTHYDLCNDVWFRLSETILGDARQLYRPETNEALARTWNLVKEARAT